MQVFKPKLIIAFFTFISKIHPFIKDTDQLVYANLLNAYDVQTTDYYDKKIIINKIVDLVNYYEYKKNPFDSIVVELVSVSKSYYEFGYSLNNYSFSHNDTFGETITPVFSNIKNGVGFFAAYQSTFLKVREKK